MIGTCKCTSLKYHKGYGIPMSLEPVIICTSYALLSPIVGCCLRLLVYEAIAFVRASYKSDALLRDRSHEFSFED